MKTEIILRDGYFEAKLDGKASLAGFREFFDLVLSHEKWKTGSAFLGDITELNSDSLTLGDVKKIVEMTGIFRNQIGRTKYAVLVTRDSEYTMARMWMGLVENHTDLITELFRSREEAIFWLTGA